MGLRRIACWLLLVSLAPAGCALDVPPRICLSPGVVVPDRPVVVFWVDGLDVERFNPLLAAGKLPNIRRYLIDRGVTVCGAAASLPTITYANNVSFNTGLFPGHHGIVGNRWFDRNRLIFQDYGFIKTYRQVDGDFAARTVYEALGEDVTATILTPVRRGATRHVDNWMSAGVAWYFDMQETVNHLTTRRFELIAEVANRAGRWPRLILAYFVTPDTVGHAEGVSSPRYTQMLLDIDRQIGHICRSLETAGLLERTCLTLVSDHGFVDTPNAFDVAGYFAQTLKVPTISREFGRDVAFEKRVAHFNKARAVVVNGGNRRTSIHLRCGDHWWQRPTYEQIESFPAPGVGEGVSLPSLLARCAAVELVAVRRGPDAVVVRAAAGAGQIDRTVGDGGKVYRYRVLSGADPLGYMGHPQAAALMDGQFHDGDEWLMATLGTGKPDCVGQLVEMMDSPRSGDIALFAADGWGLGGKDKGGHGGLLCHEIVVPWVWAGPGLPAGTQITGARTVDLMPTILHLTGRPGAIPPGLDGRSIADRLRSATARPRP
ncbi:MAG TPA: alkaline phosphatase family protein [Phycisphaerae bacterium]|nr:alkaline phosphatase family protein [Phycisphaerae bacterium]